MVVTYTKYCMARLHDGFGRNLKSVHFHKLWSEGVEITSFKLSWLMLRYCLTRSFSSRVTDGVFSKIKKRNRIKRTLPELYRTSVVTKRYVRYSALGLDCYIQLSVFFRIWFLRSLAKFLLEVVFIFLSTFLSFIMIFYESGKALCKIRPCFDLEIPPAPQKVQCFAILKR